MKVGEKYIVRPEMITGKDGNVYPVFTIQASGRGWSAKRYYTPGAGVACQLEVEVLKHDGYTHAYEKATKLKIISGGDMKMFRFARRPYVRVDGSFNVIVPDYLAGTDESGEVADCSFATAYGMWGGTGYFHISADQLEKVA